ncbi:MULTISPECIES: ATP-dependent nuclease [Winogradskyella]|uniref:ATP-dependent nuclease n=1 Tax=Winogradskyella TaxID=286104 RepID=UPI0015C850D3|nr:MULTISPECIES: AAA family ATPase [Winogradskyella]QXP78303.1 AAA family ATPase [Winogradskyella sp. HaHa_3_26]
MIFGVFLRHYKCYKNLHYIPFTTNYKNANLNLIIGKNGSGKTSILEILDVYFNKNSFQLSHDANRLDAYIAPVFIIEKTFIDKLHSNFNGTKRELEEMLNIISDFLWNLKAPNNSKPQAAFENLKNRINPSIKRETHYFLVDGIDVDSTIKFGPFEELLNVLEITFDKKKINKLSTAIRNSYNYIFIPVETDLNDYLRLENSSLQHLIGQDVKKKIDDIFDEKVTFDGSEKKIITIINENLEDFVTKVENRVQKIDNNYSFKTDPNVKKKVTSKDLRGKVIEEYFRNRTLRKNDTKISAMSSGQRKKALIDIIYSLLVNNSDTESNIILGIDEPESSLDVTNCFDQFEKIEKIANSNIQTFATTHWYGALPIVDNATISHTLEDEKQIPQITNFASSNLFDSHEAHRVEDIFFKSIYDLASSILASLRNGNKDWIIVEGHSDKIYLQSYFDLEKVKFLSIGGIDRLISLVDFLSIPLKNKSEKNYTKNKIIFLSDNDREYKSSIITESEIIYFKRYLFKNGNVELIDYIENTHGEEIRIEDVMNPKIMWEALNKLADSEEGLKSVLADFKHQKDFTLSKFGGDYSFVETDKKGAEKVALMTQLSGVIEPLKTRLALIYNDLCHNDELEWISTIKNTLNKSTKKQTRGKTLKRKPTDIDNKGIKKTRKL